MSEEKKWACADCGTSAPDSKPCSKCGSVRVVLISVLVDTFGEDWRKYFV